MTRMIAGSAGSGARAIAAELIAAALLMLCARADAQVVPRTSAPPPTITAMSAPPFVASYADIADLADHAPLIVRAEVRKLAPVEAAAGRAPRPGTARFYIEARTIALIAGAKADQSLGAQLAFLADLPIDSRGRAPVLKKREVVLFARAVPGRPGELALVAPDALLVWSPEVDVRLRGIVTALLATDAPARVTGVRELVNTPGNLAGAGETQVFLATADGSAASLSIEHSPGAPPRWGASFSELVAATDAPPVRDSLPWYRLACFLPRTPPAAANQSASPEAIAQAESDYRFVIDQLGPCPRLRR